MIIICENKNSVNAIELDKIFSIHRSNIKNRNIKPYHAQFHDFTRYFLGSLNQSKLLYVIKRNSSVIGFASIKIEDSDQCEIGLIEKDPETSEKGLVTEVVRELKKRYKSIWAYIDSLNPGPIKNELEHNGFHIKNSKVPNHYIFP